MARADFIEQLKQLGYQPVLHGTDQLVFDYVVEVGRLTGTHLQMGFQVGDDFPLTAPGGPHMCPGLRDVHPSNDLPHPDGGVHESPFTVTVGQGRWQYWSRPFAGWGQTNKTVATYMAFIRGLFDTQ